MNVMWSYKKLSSVLHYYLEEDSKILDPLMPVVPLDNSEHTPVAVSATLPRCEVNIT